MIRSHSLPCLAALAVFGLLAQGARAADTASPASPAHPPISGAATSAPKIPGVKNEDELATPVPGVFEVRRGADIVYMTGDGKYVFAGDLLKIEDKKILTETHRRELPIKLIEAVPENQMVIFSPPQP